MSYSGFRFTGRFAASQRPEDRPPAVEGDAWARDKVAGVGGTELDATFVNRLKANLERFVTRLGGNLNDGDDQLANAAGNALAGKADAEHAHDEFYYREVEIDALLAERVPIASIVDNLTSSDSEVPLSAAQGNALRQLILGLGDTRVVEDVAEAETLDDLSKGDVVHVIDDGDGKWSRYQVTAAGDGTWDDATKVVIWTQDEAPSSHSHVAADISNASADGRAILTAASFAAMRTLLSLNAPFTTRAAIKALDTTKQTLAYLNEGRRSGWFALQTGNFSAEIALDTAEGLFLPSDSVASTSAAWVRLDDGPVLSAWFGADEAAADNSAALSAWVRMIVELNLHGRLDGRYEVTAAVASATPANADIRFRLDGAPGSAIVYTSNVRREQLLRLVFDNLYVGHVEGITVDGGNYCASGIALRSSVVAPERLVVRHCVAKNLRIRTGSVSHAAGITVAAPNAAPGGYGEVTHCVVDGMRKDSGIALANQGIVNVGFYRHRTDFNRVSEIHHDGIDKYDCDGIVAFGPHVSSIYARTTGAVCHNVITNATGRGIKLQVNGNVLVQGNTGHLFGVQELITSYRFIDSQTGNTKIYDNALYADDLWTGGSESTVLQFATPGTISAENAFVRCECRRNQLYTKKRFSRFFQPIIQDVAARVEFVCDESRTYGPQDYAGTNTSLMAVDIFLVVNMPSLTNGGTFTLRAAGNEVLANYFCLLTGAAAGDRYTSMHIDFQSNTMHPLSVAQPVFASTSTWFTSDMLVAGNNIGSDGSRINGGIDFSKLRAGCSFYYGSGTPVAGPLNGSFKVLEKPNRTLIRLSDNDLIQVSFNNGAAWRMTRHRTDISPATEHVALAVTTNFTHGPGGGRLIVLTGTLAADRVVTLDTAGAIEGMTTFKFTRTGGGAFNWSIGGLKNLAQNQWCEVAYDGAAYYLVAFGSL